MNSSSTNNKMNYDVYLLDNNKDNDKYFKNEQIKFALIKNGTYVAGTTSTTGKKLSEIIGFDVGKNYGEGIVLENQEITANSKDTYKLRIWIADDVNYSGEIDENGTMTGTYNNYKYSLKVKVTSTSILNQYVMGGYLTDNDGNPLTNKTMVVYSEIPHYVKSDNEGYIFVENLEEGEHEVYYMGDITIDELKSKTKEEIIASSISSSYITTNSTSISFNNIKVNSFTMGRTDKLKVVTLNDDNNKTKKITLGNSIDFKVSDVSNYTNVYSNNGSELSYSNGTITVNKITRNTDVILSTGLGKTTSEMDNSKNYVLMINDDSLKTNYPCGGKNTAGYNSGACLMGKNLTLNVNAKKIISSYRLTIFSGENTTLNIIGDGYIGNDKTISDSSSILIRGSKLYVKSNKANACTENPSDTTSGLCIYGQYAINNWPSEVESYTKLEKINANGYIGIRNGNADITDINVYNSSYNTILIWDTAKTVNINGGYYKSGNGYAINNGAQEAVVNINDYPTYISSDNNWAIYNVGILNINTSKANQCTDTYENTTSGLCVYGLKGLYNLKDSFSKINNGFFKTKSETIYNRGDITINNGKFISDNTKAFTATNTQSVSVSYINDGEFESLNLGETINGNTYTSDWSTIAVEDNATVNIRNAEIKGKNPITIYNTATLNMCSGNIESTSGYDVLQSGIFNYSSNVKFTNGSNTPVVKDNNISLNPNYTGTCSR